MRRQLSTLALACMALGASASAQALDLTNIEGTSIAAPYVTYGDGNSYSLPVLAILYDSVFGGGTGPQNPYYVTSTPGAIKDLTVVGTGSSGQPVTTNTAGMDNAYPTPNSDGLIFFSTNKTDYAGACGSECSLPNDPGQVAPFTGDQADTWDIRLSALKGFVGDESVVFFFNNNQTNSGASTNQNLAIWAALTLYDDQNVLDPLTLYFTNLGGAYALVSEGGGGVLNGTAGNGTLGAPTAPLAGDNTATDYVLSGGALCHDANLTLVSCSNPAAVGGPINHNLGADQAVYAVVFPRLDQILASANFGGYDVLSIDWRMGCDPFTVDPEVNCVGRNLNNGYEQLFISTAEQVTQVPEPGTLSLLAGSLIGLAALRRRRKV